MVSRGAQNRGRGEFRIFIYFDTLKIWNKTRIPHSIIWKFVTDKQQIHIPSFV